MKEKTNSHGSGASIRDTNPPSVTHLEKLKDSASPTLYSISISTLRMTCEAIIKDDLENKEQDKNVRYLLMIENIKRGMK